MFCGILISFYTYCRHLIVYLLLRNGTASSAKDSGKLSSNENTQTPISVQTVRLFFVSRVEKGVHMAKNRKLFFNFTQKIFHRDICRKSLMLVLVQTRRWSMSEELANYFFFFEVIFKPEYKPRLCTSQFQTTKC